MQSSRKITKGFIEDFISDSTQAALDTKATDANLIHTFGNETKAGDLTLSDNLIVDGNASIGLGLDLTGDLNISGNIISGGDIITNDVFLIGLNSTAGIDKAGLSTSGQIVKAPDNLRMPVTNKTGVTINKGSVVYINGAQGSKATIALALANSSFSTFGLGIVEANIPNNGNGYIITHGEITGLNTSGFANGDELFLSSTTPGGLTNVAPSSPNRVVLIGTVTNPHATQGEIMIHVLYSFKVGTLSDTVITAPVNNNLLAYESATQLWKNKTANAIGLPTDADVIHKTGNEVKIGTLTATNFITIGGTNSQVVTGDGTLRPIDVVPTNGSTNPINSNAVFGALLQKEDLSNKQNNLLVDGLGNKYPTVDAVNNEFDYVQSTGVLHGGVLSINADPTKFDLSAGEGYIVNSSNLANVTRTRVTWNAFTAQTVTNLGTQLVTYVSIDSSGNIFQQATFPTVAQRRLRMIIGRINHSNLTNISFTDTFPDMLQGPMSQYFDLTNALGPFSVSGNIITANGANLSIDKSIGESFNASFNYAVNNQSPNNISHPALPLATFRHQNQNSTDGSNITVIDPTNYDVGGVTTLVPNPGATATAMRVYLFPSNVIRIQRGQAIYANLAAAISGYKNEPYVENPSNTGIAIWIATICIQKDCTSLLDTTKSKIITEPKFGGSSGAAGVTTSTLQSAYNNSSTPEIITNTTLGALTVQRGSVADTDAVIEGKNGAGTTTFTVTGAGTATAVSIVKSGAAATDALMGTGVTTILTAGTYAPTLTNVLNTSLLAINGTCSFMRIGNMVSVTVAFSVTITAANTLTRFTITLPINRSSATGTTMGNGVITGGATNYNAAIVTSTSTSNVTVELYPTVTTGAQSGNVSFQYDVTS